MSDFVGVRTRPRNNNDFAGVRLRPTQQKQVEGDSWPSFIGKSALKSITSIADLPNLGASGIEGLKNASQKYEIENNPELAGYTAPEPTDYSSYIPTTHGTRQAINERFGVDLEPHAGSAPQRVVGHGIEFGGSVTPWGFFGKAAGIANKAKEAAKLAKTGTAIGTGSGVLQEGGVNPLAADIATSTVNPTSLLKNFKKIPELATKGAHKIMGLGPKSLNIEAAQAARDLGIDLSAANLTDSTLTGLADQWIGKTPFFGNKLKHKDAVADEQISKVLADVFNKTGPAKTPEVEAKIAKLYDIRAKELPKGATVLPKNTKQAIDNIKIDTAILSPDEIKLLDSLTILKKGIEPQSKLFGPIKIPLQDFSVNKLVGTKKSLNQIIKWDLDEGVKNQLRSVQKGISQDIAEYGKTNPEWYKTFKEADKLYGDVAKREKLENLLSTKSTNQATEKLSHNALSKNINTPEKLELIKKQVSPEVFGKIKKLGTVAKAMAIKNKNVPNPSGTAVTAAAFGLIGSIATNPYAFLTGSGAGAVLGAAVGSRLLTDKKFLDLALKYAENPNKNALSSMALNKRIKEVTGYSAVALQNALAKQNSKEED